MKLKEMDSFWTGDRSMGKHPIKTDELKGLTNEQVMQTMANRFVWSVKRGAQINAQVQGVVADEEWVYKEAQRKVQDFARQLENEIYNLIY